MREPRTVPSSEVQESALRQRLHRVVELGNLQAAGTQQGSLAEWPLGDTQEPRDLPRRTTEVAEPSVDELGQVVGQVRVLLRVREEGGVEGKALAPRVHEVDECVVGLHA